MEVRRRVSRVVWLRVLSCEVNISCSNQCFGIGRRTRCHRKMKSRNEALTLDSTFILHFSCL